MSRTTFYQKNYIGHPPVKIDEYANPDSYHWQTRALDMKFWLIQKMGEQEFEEWAGRLFPGYSVEEATWKEIFELYEAKFRIYQAEEREECTCLPDLPDGRINGGRGHLCPACEADIARRQNDEIPF